MVTELDQRFKQETLNVITAMGNLLNLDIAKDQQKNLSEIFAVSVDELDAEIM
jgi:translation initiation factor 6 (eIF-6)